MMDRLLTPQEVAEMLQVPVKRLYAWKLEDTGPKYVKVGHNLRYRCSDVNEWLRGQTGGSGR